MHLHPIEIGGRRDRIATGGRAGAPMLVYLHGGPGVAERATMEAFAGPLLPHFHLVAWDQPGSGASPVAEATLDEVVDVLLELLEALRRTYRPPSITVVGHSWGSLLGHLALARRPPGVDGLVAVGPLTPGPANEIESKRLALERVESGGHRLLATLLRCDAPAPASRGVALLAKTVLLWAANGVVRPRRRLLALGLSVVTYRGYSWREKLRYLPRAVRSLSRTGLEVERRAAASPSLDVPVLFCVGRHDLVTPPALARAWFEGLEAPDARWHEFEEAAHSPHYEDPARFAAVLIRWHERRVAPCPVSTASPDERARLLVLRHGWNANAYGTLSPDLERWFGPRGDVLVAYARHAGTRVVVGAPVAPQERLGAAVSAFEADARRAGERVCWFATEERLPTLVRPHGHHAVAVLGAQPVWDPQGWSERASRVRSIRSQLNRARNKRVVVEEWARPSASDLARLRELQAAWLRAKALPTLRFLTDPDTLRFLRDRRLLVATVEARPVGFLVASPVPARGGWLVEQIVRTRTSPNGTSEAMIDAMMRRAAAEGSRYLTLGPVPLSRRRGEVAEGASPAVRTFLAWARAHGRRFYDFHGLEYFKNKLAPDRWDPVYAVSTEPRLSIRTLYAVAAAFGGGSPWTFVGRAAGRAALEELRALLASSDRRKERAV